MDKIYRVNYIVGENEAVCTIYTYPILDIKNTYILIRSGSNNRQIKKDNIGVINTIDKDKTAYCVFLTELENKDMYISQMIEKIKENAQKQVKRFNGVYKNAIQCNIKIIDVEPE